MEKVGNRGFLSELFIAALPITLQNLVAFLVTFSSFIMVGRIGGFALGAIYAAGQIQLILQILCTGIESALAVTVSKAYGENNKPLARRFTEIGVVLSALLGVLITLICISAPEFLISLFIREKSEISVAVEYLKIFAFSFPFYSISHALFASMKATDKERPSLYISLSALVINISLGAILIFGFLGFVRLEAKGSAIAILVARAFEFFLALTYLLFKSQRESKKEKTDKERYKDSKAIAKFISHGGPLILLQVVWGINVFAGSYILRGLPHQNIAASLGVANTVNNLAFVFSGGLSLAGAITLSKRRGANKYLDDPRKIIGRLELFFVFLGAVLSVSLFLLKGAVLSFYNMSEDSYKIGNELLSALGLTLLFTPYATGTFYGILRGEGKANFILTVEALLVFLVNLPLGYLFSKLSFGIGTVFFVLKIDQILKCPIAFLKMRQSLIHSKSSR